VVLSWFADGVSDNQIVWLCHSCDKPVGAGEGYLGIDLQAIQSAELDPGNLDATDPATAEETLAELLDSPEQPQWLVYHRACEPDWEEGPYRIPVADVLTPRGLLRQTGRLGKMSWLRHTDWFEILAAIPESPAETGAAEF
jgi:hypothetical protein